jgi:hypothetical protein
MDSADANRATPSWEILLYRCAVDDQFRQALIDNPTDVLTGSGLIGSGETVVVHEWRPNQRILILPPRAKLKTKMLAELNDEESEATADVQSLTGEFDQRPPHSSINRSEPIFGPSAMRVPLVGPTL